MSDTVAQPALALEPLTAQDRDAVVKLHREALGYSLNSKLGAEHLAHVYRMMCEDTSSVVLSARHSGQRGVPVGVVSATLDPESLKRHLMSGLTLRQQAGLLGRLALRPIMLVDWLEDLSLSRPVTFKGAVVAPCLTAIAVAADCRRTGVGRALVQAVEGFIRAHHGAAYHLDTRADNMVSRMFYRRLGFVEVEQRGRAIVLVKELPHGDWAG